MGKQQGIATGGVVTGLWSRRQGLARTIVLTAIAMIAFAANSVLCRLALSRTGIDPAVFTLTRLVSGAAAMWLLTLIFRGGGGVGGSWRAALALLAYAAAFSFAYVSLPAGTGALLLFGAVQGTMIAKGLLAGERLAVKQWGGLALALAGLGLLVAPGVAAPAPAGALLMAAAGIAWGIYSLLGRRSADPLAATAGNFLRAAPLALALAAPFLAQADWPATGLVYAVLSGALASGLGYALWYGALPGLTAASAASVQLSVPVITAFGGVLFLHETVSLRLVLASLAILGGIALVVAGQIRKS